MVKLCIKLNKTCDMIKNAYGSEAKGQSIVFEWHKLFHEGREQVEDEQRSGLPSMAKGDENLVKVRNLLNSDRRFSLPHLDLIKRSWKPLRQFNFFSSSSAA